MKDQSVNNIIKLGAVHHRKTNYLLSFIVFYCELVMLHCITRDQCIYISLLFWLKSRCDEDVITARVTSTSLSCRHGYYLHQHYVGIGFKHQSVLLQVGATNLNGILEIMHLELHLHQKGPLISVFLCDQWYFAKPLTSFTTRCITSLRFIMLPLWALELGGKELRWRRLTSGHEDYV